MENCMTRYALITGASSGIGLAMAEALARRGRSLLLVARQRDQLESIAIELTQRFGVEVLFAPATWANPYGCPVSCWSLKKATGRSTCW